ncbi:hypothetical protein [Candidatus Contubernalis alkaliaceticus]|uniref:hypothetical protein n=1 Tax=Candidatus Contubernalis alkaliaceticus TaxID=338645 RepID=UPI001F4BDD54|nr:hypothetical protein [Candidatus Contubernalis alkalaceticus]UNC91293.1 hypothetical protein HUE98_03835 [Candidatus Contubernalis alkalaceticus]
MALDSHYAPVPFSLNLASIILSFNDVFEDIFESDAGFQSALVQLDSVMRRNVYMSAPSLLEISRVTEKTVKNLYEVRDECSNINDLCNLLKPSNPGKLYKIKKVFNIQSLSQSPEPDWDRKATIYLEYLLDPNTIEKQIGDTVKLEMAKRIKIGKSYCRVGVQFDAEKKYLNIAYGINEQISDIKKLKVACSILSDIISFENSLNGHFVVQNNIINNHLNCIKFVLKAIFSWSIKIKLESPNIRILPPTFIGRGSLKASQWVKQYAKNQNAKGITNNDYLHELQFMAYILEILKVKGFIMCYVGSTKIILDSSNTEDAEFDGLIFLPNENHNEKFAIIVEAKNEVNGHTTGKKQLRARLEKLCVKNIDYEIIAVKRKGAYAILRITK